MSILLGQNFKAKLCQNQISTGAWVGIPHPIVIELLAREDFGFLLLDGEHAPLDVKLLGSLLPSAELHQMPTVFRVGSKSEADFKAALDAGVTGLMVPMVETADEAREIVSACRYAPMGRRGVGPWRASGYYDAFEAYMDSANDASTLILQLESLSGLSNLEEIVAVEGFDVLFVGPADLASSCGLPIGVMTEEMREMLARIAKAILRVGKVAAIDAPSPSAIPELAQMGYSVFTTGSDMAFLQTSARQLLGELEAMANP